METETVEPGTKVYTKDELQSISGTVEFTNCMRFIGQQTPSCYDDIAILMIEYANWKSDQPKVINWYDKMSIYNWLINKMFHMGFPKKYTTKVAEFISQDYANELQRAYSKGWEQAYNSAKKSDTFNYVYYPKTEAEVNSLNKAQQSKEVAPVDAISIIEARKKLLIETDSRALFDVIKELDYIINQLKKAEPPININK